MLPIMVQGHSSTHPVILPLQEEPSCLSPVDKYCIVTSGQFNVVAKTESSVSLYAKKIILCKNCAVNQMLYKHASQDKGVFLFLHILNEILLNIDIWKQFEVRNH